MSGEIQNPETRIQNPESGGRRESSGLWILDSGFFLLAAVMGGFYAYYTLFSTFRTWDDEGYVMLTIRFFNEGFPLYDDVYSQYGPFFYFVNWLIFRLGGLPIGTDNIRFVTLAFWLATALVSALVSWRMTRSYLLALLVQVLVTIHLNIADESGHPQGLACLVAVIVPLLGTTYRPGRSHGVWLGLGACAGLLVMTKVNLGVFLLIVLALLLVAGESGRFGRAVGIGVVMATLLLPALLLRSHLEATYFRNYCMTVTLALVPAILILWRREPALASSRRDQLATMLALTITIVGIAALTCLHGTRLTSVVDGVLLQHARFSTTFTVFVPFEVWSLLIAAGGLLIYQRANDARLRAVKPLAWLKLAFGLAVFAVAGAQKPTWLLTYALPFLWLVLVPEGADDRFFPRALLVLWTLVQSLQAYPVGGTQLVCATFLLIINAAVCVHDAFQEIPALQVTGHARAAASVLIGVAALGFLTQLTMMRAQRYDALVPLDLPGARRLRLPAEDVATYRKLTADLVEHADTFLTLPGFNSFHFWSQIDPPTHENTTTWMTLFDAERQRKIADAFARYPRACVIRNERFIDFWLRDQEIESLPLVIMLDRDFVTIDRAGDYEFRVRRPPGRD